MNAIRQAACSSAVAGVAGSLGFAYLAFPLLNRVPGGPTGLLLVAASVFFLTLAATLWTCGGLADRIERLELEMRRPSNQGEHRDNG
jgi:hypothetical protein